MKNLIYLSVLLSVWSLKLNAQDIDFPLLQSEIEKYEVVYISKGFPMFTLRIRTLTKFEPNNPFTRPQPNELRWM